jgi:hypothetical protein
MVSLEQLYLKDSDIQRFGKILGALASFWNASLPFEE